MKNILVADNDLKDLDMLETALQLGGYNIIRASSPEEAVEVANLNRLDLAIIDFRLRGDDATDDSGLWVAQRLGADIPKIMVSSLADKEDYARVIEASKGLSPLISRFLRKEQIRDAPNSFLNTISLVLIESKSRERTARRSVESRLDESQKHVRFFDKAHSWLHLVSATVFFILMVPTVISIEKGSQPAIYAFVALLFGEGVTYWLAKKGHSVSTRADNYHRELLQAARYEELLGSCSEIEDASMRDQSRRDLVLETAQLWLNEMPNAGVIRDPQTRLIPNPPEQNVE